MKKIISILSLIILISHMGFAQSLTTFSSGDIISADAMNGNFTELYNYLFWKPLADPNQDPYVGDLYFTGGNIGIGTDTPDVQFEIATNGNSATGLTSTGGDLRISDWGPQIDFVDAETMDWAIHVNSDKMFFIREPWEQTMVLWDEKVGIGTNTPDSMLEIASIDSTKGLTGEAGTFTISANAPQIDFVDSDGSDWAININNDRIHFLREPWASTMVLWGGKVGIGTTSPTANLHVEGTIYATGDISEFSDARAKENIETIENPLEILEEINGVYFNMINSTKRDVGVLAQDVQKTLPEAVSVVDEEMGLLAVSYTDLVPVLIEAVKEQQAQIKDLKAELEILKGVIAE